MDIGESIATFINERWYWIVIVFFGVLIIVLIAKYLKSRKDIKYYDQIKLNKETLGKELELNPTEIKWIRYVDKRYKVLGESFIGYTDDPEVKIKEGEKRELEAREIKELELKALSDHIKGKGEFKTKYHIFAAKTKFFLNIIPRGETQFIVLRSDEFKRTKTDTIRINERVRLMYRDGIFCSNRFDSFGIVTDTTERLLRDNLINAFGHQQKEFSRIRTDYAHVEKMKDKDIEYEKEKEKISRHR